MRVSACCIQSLFARTYVNCKLYIAVLAIIFTFIAVPVNATVTVTISPSNPNMCTGNSQQFTATGSTSGCEGSGTNSYQWWITDATHPISGATNSTYNYTATSAGTVILGCTVSAGTCGSGQNSATISITAAGLTLTDPSASPSSPTICDTVTFQASASENCGGGSGITYSWNFGDGATGTGSSPTHQYSSAGQYTVRVTASDGTNSASKTLNLTVSAEVTPGAPSNLQITNTASHSISLSWSGGSGASSYQIFRSTDGQNGTFSNVGSSSGTSYTDTGISASTNYCYYVVAVNNCGHTGGMSNTVCGTTTACDGTVSIQSASANPSSQIAGQSVNFQAQAASDCGNTSGYTYSWTFGDGGTSNQQNPTHTYTAPNKDSSGNIIPYQAVVTVNSLTKTVPVTINYDGQDPDPGADPGDTCSDSDVNPFNGNWLSSFEDPVATRGFPIGYEVAINTQAVDMNRPLANAAFTYDIHVGQQMVYNTPCNGSQHWMVVDANGKQLDFGPVTADPTPKAGIFSQLQVLRDANSNVTGYQLLNADEPGALKLAGNFSYLFNAMGQLTQITDPQGNPQTITYNVNNQLASVLDVNTQKSLAFTYSNGQVSQIALNGGVSAVNFAYVNNRLSQIAVVNNQNVTVKSHRYVYYSDGTLQSVTKDNDNASTVNINYTTYASKNCLKPLLVAQKSYASGMVAPRVAIGTSAPATGVARTSYVTNVKNGKLQYNFDSKGNVLKITYPTFTGASQAKVETFGYNSNNLLTSFSDGTTSEISTYTTNGLLSTYKDALNNVWSYGYSGVDQTSSQNPVQQALSVSSTTAYGDPALPHIATSDTDALGNTWTYAHNAYGQITQVTPPIGSPSGAYTTTYDETSGSQTLGYPLKSTDGNNNIQTVDSYDSLGDPLQISTYPVNGNTTTKNTTTYTYDADQRVTSITRPDNKVFQNIYTGRNLTSTIDEAGTQYNYGYCGPCGALTSISGPLNWSLGWTVDGDHDVTSFTDARGKTTQYAYGSAGELKSVTTPDNIVNYYLYNNAGLLRQIANGRNDIITLSYDANERLHQVTFPTSGQHSLTYDYNSDNTLHDFIDAAGTTTIAYQANGWVQSVIYNYATAGLANAQEIDYTYYPDGLRHTMVWKNGSSTVGTWTYGYDAGGRLTSLANPWNETTTWAYDGEDKITQQANANNTTVNYTYNQSTGWITNIAHKHGSNVLASYALTYDNGSNTVGNITKVTENDGSVVNYTYDALYRLTNDVRTGSNAYSRYYNYDLAGNRTSCDTFTATYDAGNKVATCNNASVPYDGDGNWQCSSSNALIYDDLNHLTFTYISPAPPMTYTYDARGMRIASAPNGGTKTYYIFDGDTLLGEVQNTSVTAAYTWGADGLVSERLPGNGQSLWYHFGPQGDTRLLTNSSGSVADTYTFYAYGSRVASTGSDYNAFQYGGKYGYYLHPAANSNGYLCGQRWYASAYGFFFTRDPIGYDGGENLYTYCYNNPLGQIDPNGCASMSKSDCVKLLGEIAYKAGLLAHEWAKYDPVKDYYGGFPMAGGGITKPGGHYQEMNSYKNGIKNDIKRYIENCIKKNCGGDGKTSKTIKWAGNLAAKPIPIPRPYAYTELNDAQLVCKSVATACGIIIVVITVKSAAGGLGGILTGGAGAGSTAGAAGAGSTAGAAGSTGGSAGVLGGGLAWAW